MKKPAIPSVPTMDTARVRFDASIKERLEIIGGERSDKLRLLESGSTLEETIAKVNELIGVLQ